MNKYFISLLVIGICFFAVNSGAVVFESKKGNVTFDHEVHSAELACISCHHTEKDATLGAAVCSVCHNPEAELLNAKNVMHKSCKGCHEEMQRGPTKCNGCHVKE